MNQNPNNNPLRPPTRPTLPPGKFAPRPNKPKPPEDSQDTFIRQLAESKALCSVVTITGQQLVGKISAHGKFTITLQAPNSSHAMLLYKSALISIAPKLQAAAGVSA